MNNSFLGLWAYASEGDALDFKREQYKFIDATEIEKSELLKDILAMINSWRQDVGYIVVGIEDRPEKPNIFHGINDHIDDASIQQFVKSKASSICHLEYSTLTNNGLTFGVFKFPVQKRPVYLLKDYGKLKAETVYVRRGSSTDIAKPSEIANMGLGILNSSVPKLSVQFYDRKIGRATGLEMTMDTKFIKIIDGIPDYCGPIGSRLLISSLYLKEYNRDLINYFNFDCSYHPIVLSLTNSGSCEAVNVRIEIEITSENIDILLDGEEIKAPEKEIFRVGVNLPPAVSSYSLEKRTNSFVIYNRIDRIHAKRTLDLDGIIYIQEIDNKPLDVSVKVFYDGAEAPVESTLKIYSKCRIVELEWEEFNEIMSQR